MNMKDFPEMLTHSTQLTVGLVLWHVYGHLPKHAISCQVVHSLPNTNNNVRLPAFEVIMEGYSYPMKRFCGDCGLNGYNHNDNRLFFSREAALRYHAACKAAGYQDNPLNSLRA